MLHINKLFKSIILLITLFILSSCFNDDTITTTTTKKVRDHIKEVVIDNNTALMWQDSRPKHSNWRGAVKYCRDLTLAKYDDWRLPNFNELFYLADKNQSNPAINNTFRNTAEEYYWTSTPAYLGKSKKWVVNFSTGKSEWGHINNDYYARCVRGINKKINKNDRGAVNFANLQIGQSKKSQKGIARDFSRDDKINIVTDNLTKLQWQDNKVSAKLAMKWQEAKENCNTLNFADYNDWRMPSINELVSITNKSVGKDTSYKAFKDIKKSYYWSSTSYVKNDRLTWTVNFNNGTTISMSKAHSLHLKCVRNAGKNKPSKNIVLKHKNDEKLNKKLYKAVEESNIKLVKELIKQGGNVNYINTSSDFTALMQAASNSNIEIVKYLVEQGADINHSGMNGSALFKALKTHISDKRTKLSKNREVADYLISQGIDLELTDSNKGSALMDALKLKNIAAFKYLVEKGADINQRNEEGSNILFYLILNYWSDCEKCTLPLELMQYAIDNKVDIDSPDDRLHTPLHTAILFGRNKLTKILIENGANLNIRDIDGVTPIYFAVYNNDFKTTKYLIEKGARLDIKGYDGTDLYGYALGIKNDKIIELLKDIKPKTK